MKAINKKSKITIYWKIWRGVNKVTEDFSNLSTNLKVFLMGHDDVIVLNPSVNKYVDPGYEVLEMTISAGTLDVGAYSIKAVWAKNDGRDLLTSMRSGVFGITDSDAEASVTDEEIRLVSSVESYGRDGMSAFETAVMRNLNNGISSEVEWVGNEAKRIADEEARDVAEKARDEAEKAREGAEAKRVDTFNANEATRQTTFETNETNRGATFTSNETSREEAYLLSEQDREVRFAAAEENRNKGEAIRQAAFEGGENNRASTFTRNEESRQRRFEDEVEQRSEAFNAYENSRQRAFEQAEKDRGLLFRSKEDAREADELKRDQAEAIRNAQESVRQQAEQIRIDTFDENERGRIATFNANEAARIAAENERKQNEAERETNEAIRQESYKDKLPVSAVVQETGDGENVVMSQKAVSGKLTELDTKKQNVPKTSSDVDFEITDENGNAIMQIQGGELYTKKFNSEHVVKLNRLKGKTLSVLGDSISTFEGALVSDKDGYNGTSYVAYYPRYEVNDYTQTWWGKLLKKTGMKLGNLCAWSGSRVTGNSSNNDSASAGCSNKRVSDIGYGNITPDIIIVLIGINDIQTATIGSWNGGEKLPLDGVITTFREAYATMVAKVMTSYPTSEIYCCTILDSGKEGWDGDDSLAFPTINPNTGMSVYSMNEAIRDIANSLGAKIIDMHSCGIHYFNLDIYTGDRLHPNINGMELMAKKAFYDIINNSKF